MTRHVILLLGLLFSFLGVLTLGLALGAVPIPIWEVLSALTGSSDPQVETIVLGLRLPRVLLAAEVGAGLAVAGAVFQALLRNPLAEPYILGVSSGAAVGAVMAIILGMTVNSMFALPVAAFLGAAMAIILVLAMARAAGRGLDTHVLLLAGVVIGAFFNAVVLLLVTFADLETFRAAMLWIMGSFSGATWQSVTMVAVWGLPALTVLTAFARPLNLLSVGEQSAFHLGVDVRQLKIFLYVGTSFLVGVCVAGSGAIGFVGLVVPHALRLVGGSDHRWLLPACAMTGGGFLVFADTVARTVLTPAELPVGVVTALLGVPVFLWLLVRSEESL